VDTCVSLAVSLQQLSSHPVPLSASNVMTSLRVPDSRLCYVLT
jgi:hypothetical protein